MVYTKVGARGVARHWRRRDGGLAGGNRSLCAADCAAHARAARRDLGPRRNRRHRTDRQPLRRSGGPHLHRGRRSGRARDTLRTGSAERLANMEPSPSARWNCWLKSYRRSSRQLYSAASRHFRSHLARKSSISVKPFGVSTCQKVQPLQASSPCAKAPMRWIEPTASPSDKRAVGAHQRAMPALGVDEFDAGRDHAALDQRRERHPRRLARGHERGQRRLRHRLDRVDALLRRLGVVRFRARSR